MTKRAWILFASAIPVLGLIAVLGWASAQSGGNPGGLAVNRDFGQVKIDTAPARPFSLNLLEGGTLEWADLEGKAVVLDFWASWCGPCRHEAPALAQVYLEYADLPVEFVGINLWDQKEGALQHVNQFSVPYPNGIDSRGIIAIDYGVRGIPEKYFISSAGLITRKFEGPMSAEDLRASLNELLASSSTSSQ